MTRDDLVPVLDDSPTVCASKDGRDISRITAYIAEDDRRTFATIRGIYGLLLNRPVSTSTVIRRALEALALEIAPVMRIDFKGKRAQEERLILLKHLR